MSLLAMTSAFVLLGASSCSGTKGKVDSVAEGDVCAGQTMVAAPFDTDSAYRYVADQVTLGPRVPGSEAHRACREYILSHLRDWGYQVMEQSFEGRDYSGKVIKGYNLIALHPSEQMERVLLMAHWDTRPVADEELSKATQGRPILGADDGASGVGILLELARQYAVRKPVAGLDFVFFDLEDGGVSGQDDSWCQGSQYWSEHPHTPGYKAQYGILLDMVGGRDARFYWEGNSKAYAMPQLAGIWETAVRLGWGKYFIQSDGGTMIDDHVPVIKHRQIPSIDIINFDPTRGTGFPSYWHTLGDNLNVISTETLQAVGQTLSTVLAAPSTQTNE